MIFLLDTNVLSEPVKPRPNIRVQTHIQQRQFDVCVSATVWQEFALGIELLPPTQRRMRLVDYRHFLQQIGLEILPFDQNAAEWMAREQARLYRAGRAPVYRDLQIASVAAVHDLILITRNVRDFEHFLGIRLENWFES